MGLGEALRVDDVALVAPQAAGSTWYPQSFLAPLEANEPYLDSALRRIAGLVNEFIAAGVGSDKIALLGFSQGACLSSEFVARNPRRYGAVMALTGGLIGPPDTERSYSGSLEGTPVFLGTSDPDMHVPYARVEETRDVLTAMGAGVELRRYPGMPHTVNEEELEVCRRMLKALVEPGGATG
jgi:predicted esterase